jgi:hypothetical protein
MNLPDNIFFERLRSAERTSSSIFRSVAVLATSALCIAAQAADPDFLGCWRGIRVVQYDVAGPAYTNSISDCTESISARTIHSACSSKGNETTYEYDYRVVAPGKYSATIRASTNRPDLVGSTRDYFYRVEGDRLYTTTYPQTTTPAPPTAAVRVESESVRVECNH